MFNDIPRLLYATTACSNIEMNVVKHTDLGNTLPDGNSRRISLAYFKVYILQS